MNDQTRLAEALHARAESLHAQHPLRLEDVKGRARGIRRRRVAASGLVAAAVLAVGVPAGMAMDARLQRGTQPGPAQTTQLPLDPSETPAEEPTPSPPEEPTTDPQPTPIRAPMQVTLDPGVTTTSGPAGIPLLDGDVIRLPSGGEVPVPPGTIEFVPLGQAWLVFAVGGGVDSVSYLDAAGDQLWSAPAVNGPAVTADGRIAAFTQPDGWTVTVAADGERYRMMSGTKGPHEAAAIIGGAGSCGDDGPLGTCVVYANALDDLVAVSITQEDTGSGQTRSRSERVDDLTGHVRSVSGDLLLSRTVSVDPRGSSCSQVDALSTGERLFGTCAYAVEGFSPDGRFAIGRPAYRSGIGDGMVAILDARTGQPLVEYRNDASSQAFVAGRAWDGDGSLLATVISGERTHLMRMTVDGRLSHATLEGRSEWPSPDGIGIPVGFPSQP